MKKILLQKFSGLVRRSHVRLFLLFIVITIIPLVVASSITINFLTSQMEEQILLSLDRENEQLKTILNSELNRTVTIGHLISANSSLRQCMTQYRAGYADYDETLQKVRTILKEYSPMQYGMHSLRPVITIVGADGAAFGESQYLGVLQAPAFQEVVRNFVASYNQYDMRWVSDAELFGTSPPQHNSVNYALHSIRSASNWGSIGVIVFQFRQSNLLAQYMSSVTDEQSTFILDASERLLSQMNNLGIAPETLNSLYSGTEADGTYFSTLDGKKTLVSIYQIPTTKWRVVTVSDVATQMQNVNQVTALYLFIVAGCLLLALILSYRLSIYFTKPVKNISTSMNLVMQGDLSARVKRISNDELGDLVDQFNRMVERIAKLMNQVIVEQEAKRRSDIQFLQSQINPHFLYNTLASLRYMVLMGDKENAETSILALNHILKHSLSDTRQYITINMEADQLNNYLTIAKFGFEEPLETLIEIDPAIGDCLTIRLLLQPIVENAVLHGLKTKKDSPKLLIRGYAAGDDIEFSVEDNGSGFDVAALDLQEAAPHDPSHIGIKNVDTRIKLQFGQRYGLTIHSKIGKGTKVIIRIPKIIEQEEIVLYENSDR